MEDFYLEMKETLDDIATERENRVLRAAVSSKNANNYNFL